jgi:hypothetical protein
VLPKLALISQFPDAYQGATANLSADSSGGSQQCVKAPSQRLGDVSVLQPGDGQCGSNGLVAPGTYTLDQAAPAGTVFLRWELFDITTGTALGPELGSSVTLSGNMSVTAVAVYGLLVSPSPSPSQLPR